MKKTPKCDKCGKRYFINHPTDGVPVMVGFQLEDGSILNYCYKEITISNIVTILLVFFELIYLLQFKSFKTIDISTPLSAETFILCNVMPLFLERVICLSYLSNSIPFMCNCCLILFKKFILFVTAITYLSFQNYF